MAGEFVKALVKNQPELLREGKEGGREGGREGGGRMMVNEDLFLTNALLPPPPSFPQSFDRLTFCV